jgi:hypothetical protein
MIRLNRHSELDCKQCTENLSQLTKEKDRVKHWVNYVLHYQKECEQEEFKLKQQHQKDLKQLEDRHREELKIYQNRLQSYEQQHRKRKRTEEDENKQPRKQPKQSKQQQPSLCSNNPDSAPRNLRIVQTTTKTIHVTNDDDLRYKWLVICLHSDCSNVIVGRSNTKKQYAIHNAINRHTLQKHPEFQKDESHSLLSLYKRKSPNSYSLHIA